MREVVQYSSLQGRTVPPHARMMMLQKSEKEAHTARRRTVGRLQARLSVPALLPAMTSFIMRMYLYERYVVVGK